MHRVVTSHKWVCCCVVGETQEFLYAFNNWETASQFYSKTFPWGWRSHFPGLVFSMNLTFQPCFWLWTHHFTCFIWWLWKVSTTWALVSLLYNLFQGWEDPYVPRTHEGLLKWKYAHMNSVDFVLKVLLIYQLLLQQLLSMFAWFDEFLDVRCLVPLGLWFSFPSFQDRVFWDGLVFLLSEEHWIKSASSFKCMSMCSCFSIALITFLSYGFWEIQFNFFKTTCCTGAGFTNWNPVSSNADGKGQVEAAWECESCFSR